MTKMRGKAFSPSCSERKKILCLCLDISEVNSLSKYFIKNIDSYIEKYGVEFVKSYLVNNKNKLSQLLEYKKSLFDGSSSYKLNYLNKIIEFELANYKLPKKEEFKKYDMYMEDINKEWRRKSKKPRRSWEELNSLVDVVLAKKEKDCGD